jgi:hypothetical protein
VGGGPGAAVEALLVGSDLVAAGDADYVVVVAADEVSAVVRELFSAAGLSTPTHGARAVVLGTEPLTAASVARAVLAEILTAGLGESGVQSLTTALSRATRT